MISGGIGFGVGDAIGAGSSLVGGLISGIAGEGDKTPNAFFDKNKWLAMALMKARMGMKPRQFSAMPEMPGSWSPEGNQEAQAMALANARR